MARQITKPIPSEFRKFDSTVTDADEYVNVRDLQTARRNHNILLTRGSRKVIFSQDIRFDTISTSELYAIGGQVGSEDVRNNFPVLTAPVLIAPYVKQVTAVIFATPGSVDVEGRMTLEPMGGLREFAAATSVTFTSSTTLYEVDIPVPYLATQERHGYRVMRWSLYLLPETGSAIVTGKTIVSVTSDNSRIEVNNADLSTVAIGDVLYFSDATIPSRIIINVTVAGGSTRYLRVDKPFGPAPTAGSDTWSVKDRGDIVPLTFTLLEKVPTDFDGSHGVL